MPDPCDYCPCDDVDQGDHDPECPNADIPEVPEFSKLEPILTMIGHTLTPEEFLALIPILADARQVYGEGLRLCTLDAINYGLMNNRWTERIKG